MLTWGTPKSHQASTVSVPGFLVPLLAELCEGRERGDLVFRAPECGPVRINNFRRREFDAAVAATVGGHLRPHDLRHTATSLAARSGSNVKVVQSMLGHADAAMTLNRYTHLFRDDLEAAGTRLDEARAAALADVPRSRDGAEAKVVALR